MRANRGVEVGAVALGDEVGDEHGQRRVMRGAVGQGVHVAVDQRAAVRKARLRQPVGADGEHVGGGIDAGETPAGMSAGEGQHLCPGAGAHGEQTGVFGQILQHEAGQEMQRVGDRCEARVAGVVARRGIAREEIGGGILHRKTFGRQGARPSALRFFSSASLALMTPLRRFWKAVISGSET